MLGHIPERGEQFQFIRARHELHRAAFHSIFLKIFCDVEHLAALRFGVQHRDAHDVSGQRPETEHADDLFALGGTRGFVGDFFRLAQQIFLLNFVKVLQWLRGSFDVEYESGHGKLC